MRRTIPYLTAAPVGPLFFAGLLLAAGSNWLYCGVVAFPVAAFLVRQAFGGAREDGYANARAGRDRVLPWLMVAAAPLVASLLDFRWKGDLGLVESLHLLACLGVALGAPRWGAGYACPVRWVATTACMLAPDWYRSGEIDLEAMLSAGRIAILADFVRTGLLAREARVDWLLGAAGFGGLIAIQDNRFWPLISILGFATAESAALGFFSLRVPATRHPSGVERLWFTSGVFAAGAVLAALLSAFLVYNLATAGREMRRLAPVVSGAFASFTERISHSSAVADSSPTLPSPSMLSEPPGSITSGSDKETRPQSSTDGGGDPAQDSAARLSQALAASAYPASRRLESAQAPKIDASRDSLSASVADQGLATPGATDGMASLILRQIVPSTNPQPAEGTFRAGEGSTQTMPSDFSASTQKMAPSANRVPSEAPSPTSATVGKSDPRGVPATGASGAKLAATPTDPRATSPGEITVAVAQQPGEGRISSTGETGQRQRSNGKSGGSPANQNNTAPSGAPGAAAEIDVSPLTVDISDFKESPLGPQLAASDHAPNQALPPAVSPRNGTPASPGASRASPPSPLGTSARSTATAPSSLGVSASVSQSKIPDSKTRLDAPPPNQGQSRDSVEIKHGSAVAADSASTRPNAPLDSPPSHGAAAGASMDPLSGPKVAFHPPAPDQRQSAVTSAEAGTEPKVVYPGVVNPLPEPAASARGAEILREQPSFDGRSMSRTTAETVALPAGKTPHDESLSSPSLKPETIAPGTTDRLASAPPKDLSPNLAAGTQRLSSTNQPFLPEKSAGKPASVQSAPRFAVTIPPPAALNDKTRFDPLATNQAPWRDADEITRHAAMMIGSPSARPSSLLNSPPFLAESGGMRLDTKTSAETGISFNAVHTIFDDALPKPPLSGPVLKVLREPQSTYGKTTPPSAPKTVASPAEKTPRKEPSSRPSLQPEPVHANTPDLLAPQSTMSQPQNPVDGNRKVNSTNQPSKLETSAGSTAPAPPSPGISTAVQPLAIANDATRSNASQPSQAAARDIAEIKHDGAEADGGTLARPNAPIDGPLSHGGASGAGVAPRTNPPDERRSATSSAERGTKPKMVYPGLANPFPEQAAGAPDPKIPRESLSFDGKPMQRLISETVALPVEKMPSAEALSSPLPKPESSDPDLPDHPAPANHGPPSVSAMVTTNRPIGLDPAPMRSWPWLAILALVLIGVVALIFRKFGKTDGSSPPGSTRTEDRTAAGRCLWEIENLLARALPQTVRSELIQLYEASLQVRYGLGFDHAKVIFLENEIKRLQRAVSVFAKSGNRFNGANPNAAL